MSNTLAMVPDGSDMRTVVVPVTQRDQRMAYGCMVGGLRVVFSLVAVWALGWVAVNYWQATLVVGLLLAIGGSVWLAERMARRLRL